MPESRTFVVVGGGLAGAKAVEALRDQGFDGRLVLVGDEQYVPYERPPLSKDYLQGKSERDSVFVHPRPWYDEHDVELRLGVAATALDPAAHRLGLADGSTIDYDKLLIATGSQPRVLPVPGAGLDGVLHLRDLDDSDAIKEAIAKSRRIAIVGAGWIGLETAAAARAAGVDVTIVEMAELPLLRVLGREVAQIYADLHREHGVDLRVGVTVDELTGSDGRVTGVALADGSHIDADAVIVGAGIAPRTALAESGGLTVDNGIVVDAHLRTSDADVYAAGDVANADHPLLGRRVRVEHWANALNQPKVAAASMLGGDETYERLPYFYSDQYDLGMEYSGYVAPGEYDEVVFRGDVGKREFVAFWLSGGSVLAGMNANVWDVTDAIQALVRDPRPVDAAKLADPSVPLDSLLD